MNRMNAFLYLFCIRKLFNDDRKIELTKKSMMTENAKNIKGNQTHVIGREQEVLHGRHKKASEKNTKILSKMCEHKNTECVTLGFFRFDSRAFITTAYDTYNCVDSIKKN